MRLIATRLTATLLASALIAPAALAQTATLPAPAIPVQTLKDVTKELSSDAYEGRAPTTAGETKTIDYLVKRMKAAGLKPGNAGKWTQDVPMVASTASAVRPMVFSGGTTPLSLAYKSDMVVGTYRVVPQVSIANSPVVFVGYGVNAPEKGWNDYAGLDVKGKTVIILSNDPDWAVPETKGLFNGREMTYYGRWTYKFEEAARQGATAAIIVHDTEPAAYPWAVVQSSWTGEQYELDAANNHMDQSQAIGWIQLAQAKALFSSAGKDFAALSRAAATKGFRAVPLGVTMSVGFENKIKKSLSHNVIGVLPGKPAAQGGAPGDYVLYSAHWDHLGRCEPVNGDDICNGAVDNASGTAGLIALAETFAKAPPTRRSVAFLAVTAEESGLLGSAYYAQHPVFPLARTVAGINMDVLNVNGAVRDFEITGAGKSELEDMVKPLLAAQGRRITPEATPEKGHYFRSDHFSFAKLGVPMLAGGSGEDLVNGGVAAGKAAAEDYTANRYHKPQDEYRADWNWDGAVQDLTIYYQLGRELADGNAWPNWYKTAEFRAARDRSRAGAAQ
ncbi:Zn-dependent amino-or carboxypeptidase, M28 family [Sphingomonas palmae]|uniref:Zn-dependent amino-or carboxypeptidase, M28 family n=1 Tax=Sphingomonas palmae TaxID=1855283 RepID=A0A1H7KNG8_9SPHN|nr:M28 family metallopeptidase [Sphingomonas palmae]SEK88339.1 Zn-dependent amino-or carboxypeptidase, M28 family [Sphingomonas palmae]